MNVVDAINNRRAGDTQDINELVTRWNKYHLDKDGSALHEYLKPTISSALNSFAAGQTSLRVPAYKLAFEAIASYDPSKGADVKTHVYNGLRRLSRVSAQRGNIVHIPEDNARDYKIISRAIADFTDDRGREPNDDELSDITGLSRKRIDRIMNRNSIISSTESFTEEGGDRVKQKGISTDTYLDYLHASSDDIDKGIIEMSSGWRGRQLSTNADIAKRLGITPAAVSQRMNKLRERMTELKGLL